MYNSITYAKCGKRGGGHVGRKITGWYWSVYTMHKDLWERASQYNMLLENMCVSSVHNFCKAREKDVIVWWYCVIKCCERQLQVCTNPKWLYGWTVPMRVTRRFDSDSWIKVIFPVNWSDDYKRIHAYYSVFVWVTSDNWVDGLLPTTWSDGLVVSEFYGKIIHSNGHCS